MSLTPQIPENAPFSESQRLWLDGYIAGIINQRANTFDSNELIKESTKTKVLIMYASQSGNSQELAEQFGSQLEASGFEAPVFSADDYEDINFNEQKLFLLISSTWGDGDPPDNGIDFWNHLKSENHPRLENLKYSVLGLGDKNYLHFCAMGEKFDSRLNELGATRLTARGECDVDYEETAENWFNEVLKKLDASIKNTSTKKETISYSKKKPFPASLAVNKKLNKKGSLKNTHHFELNISGSNLSYEAGDVLGVFPVNDPEIVDEIIEKLEFNPEEEIFGTNIRSALLENYDIRTVTKDFISNWADKTNSKELNQIIESSSLDSYIMGREIIDIIIDYPIKFSKPVEFISLLRKLSPRLYSISSSPKACIDEVHLTVAKVNYNSHGRPRKGVCSNYLADRLSKNEKVKVYFQSSKHFKLPKDSTTPIIMVGPGTGIAPFRAFLQERHFEKSLGKNWLFFGNPHEETDFLYEDELLKFKEEGILTNLSTAWSRDHSEKIYVQDLMAKQGEEIWKWLEGGAYFYVCGDAKFMAKDVDDTLHEIINNFGSTTGEEYIKAMKKERRYQRDVY